MTAWLVDLDGRGRRAPAQAAAKLKEGEFDDKTPSLKLLVSPNLP
jgi:hypothetical protein